MPTSLESGGVRFPDNTLQSTAAVTPPPPPPPTTAQVLSATAGASLGAVGTYAFLGSSTPISGGTARTSPGGTIAGSSLRYAGQASPRTSIASTGPSGTWRCMGFERNGDFSNSRNVVTLWLRIS